MQKQSRLLAGVSKMTNEERQALIEWLQGEKSVSYQQNVKFIRLAREIALAALTAEPVKVPDEVGIHDLDPESKDVEVVTAIAQCEGWNACLAEVKRLNGLEEKHDK